MIKTDCQSAQKSICEYGSPLLPFFFLFAVSPLQGREGSEKSIQLRKSPDDTLKEQRAPGIGPRKTETAAEHLMVARRVLKLAAWLEASAPISVTKIGVAP